MWGVLCRLSSCTDVFTFARHKLLAVISVIQNRLRISETLSSFRGDPCTLSLLAQIQMEELKTMLEDALRDLATLKDNDIKMQADIEAIKRSTTNQEDKCAAIEKTVSDLRAKVNRIQEQSTVANIIFYNVPDNDETNQNLLENVIRILINANISIPEVCFRTAFRLGKQNNRPILVKLIAPRWKKLIFENITNLHNQNIFVDNDIPKEVRVKQKRLLKARYLLKQKGKKAITKNDEILIDGAAITETEIDQLILSETQDNNELESAEDKDVENSNKDILPNSIVNSPRNTPNTVAKKTRTIRKTTNSSSGATLDSYVSLAPRSTRNKNHKKK